MQSIMKYSDINHSGYINTKNGKHIAYDLIDGRITIHANEYIPELDNTNMVITSSFDKGQFLFCTRLPIDLTENIWYPQHYKHPIDCVIKNFQLDAKYTKAIFSFSELQCFCPSFSVISRPSKEEFLISTKPKIVKAFEIMVDNVLCKLEFVIRLKDGYSLGHGNLETYSQIEISFDETFDLRFLYKIYRIVDSVFAFICNHQNTACIKMSICGNYPSQMFTNRDTAPCISDIYFIDEYREEPEEKNQGVQLINSRKFFQHIDVLFKMVAEDISTDKDESVNISISSIHPSLKRRRLIDLQQSLHITAAFEFYVRRYLPNMVEEKEYHVALKRVLKEFADVNTGKAKKLAKSLLNHVVSEPSLSDKIMKAYNGFSTWKPLKACVSQEWFKEDEIETLAEEANLWRNELAHEKRSYESKVDTIRAIRLVEHLNYAIVLRQLGYDDGEIQELLKYTLLR